MLGTIPPKNMVKFCTFVPIDTLHRMVLDSGPGCHTSVILDGNEHKSRVFKGI